MAAVRIGQLIALDSNFLIAARKMASREGARLERWLGADCIIEVSAVAWSEYLCGPVLADDIAVSRGFISRVEPFTEKDAALAGELFNQTGRRPRSHADCMIASHAIGRGALLATLNLQDFRRFEKFKLRLLPL
jgi:predicted nucleic acid-binding protein